MFGLCLLCPFSGRCDNAPIFSRTLGGGPADDITALSLDPAGNIVAAGFAVSPNLPVTNGSHNPGTQFSVSTDHGATWAPLSNLPSGSFSVFALSPASSKVVYAGSSTGLFRSADGGATWSATAVTDPVVSIAPDPASALGIYAGTQTGIVHSIDGGATFTDITNNFPKNGAIYQPLYIVLDPFHSGVIYAGTNLIDARSSDGGKTWNVYQLPGAGAAVHIAPVFDPLQPGVIYVGDTWGLLRSTDGGQTWYVLNVPVTQPQAIAVLPTAPGNVWACGFDGLIYRSTDGGNTFALIQPTGNQRYWGMTVDPFLTSTILTYDFRTADGGATWQSISLGRSGIYAFDPSTPGRVIAEATQTSDAFIARLDPNGNILFATYLGGLGNDAAAALATDASGNIYVTGTTTSPDFPSTVPGGPAFPVVPFGGTAASFAAKFDAQGNLLYSTPIPIALPHAIAADAQGNALITGRDCIILKLSPDGARTVFSTAIANAANCSGIAVDGAGNAVVVGSTTSVYLPWTGDALQTSYRGGGDGMLARLDANGNLIYASYIGGSGSDGASAVALDANGNIYITGGTSSSDFPVTSGVYQTALRTGCPYPTGSVETGFIGTIFTDYTANAFILKLDPQAHNEIYSTYLGGNCLDSANSIAVDPNGNVWIAGASDSSTFPQVWPVDTPPAYGDRKSFVTRLAASGAWLWRSSFVAAGLAIAADSQGNAYVGGTGTILLKIGPQ